MNESIVLDIGRLARDDFRTLQEDPDLKTPTAKFFYYPDSENAFSIIKVFYGPSAESLYIQEVSALYALRKTGRVSEVFCDSSSGDARFWDTEFSGPYFIAKPYYRTSLETVISKATDFEKLDLAAQEVQMARELVDLGWRDWDWSIRNDVVEAGKVVRVDLDSVTNLTTLLKDKANINDPRYFSTDERQTIKEFLLIRESVTNQAKHNEVTNMAIRLSYLLLPDNDHAELTDQILKIQNQNTAATANVQNSNSPFSSEPGFGSSSGRTRLLRGPLRSKRFISKSFSRLLGSTPEPHSHTTIGLTDRRSGSTSDGSVKELPESFELATPNLKEWLSLWSRRTVQDEEGRGLEGAALLKLTTNEWQSVPLLIYHLIVQPQHGFRLEDLYTTLMALNIVCIRQRISNRPELKGGNALTDSLSPNIGFLELKQFLKIKERLQKASADSQLVQAEPERVEMRPVQVTCFADGDSWKATSKKLNRESEDKILHFQKDGLTVAALTDGVSEAQGLASAEVVISEIEAWCNRLVNSEVQDLSSEVRDLLNDINFRLFAKYRETKNHHQATVALAVVASNEQSCRISIVQAGDSNCVVFSPDGSIRISTLGWKTQRLGLTPTIKDGGFRVEYINLEVATAPSLYRLRLFSDGVGEPGFERVKQIPSVEDLVIEAANWGKSLGIGSDDWSVVGADILVEQGPIISKRRTDAHESPVQTTTSESREFIAAINSVSIELSKPARRFWVELEDWRKRRSRVAGLTASDSQSPPSEPRRDGSLKVGDGDITWATVAFTLGALLLVALIIVAYLYLSSPKKDANSNDEKGRITTTDGASNSPVLLNDRQKRVYAELNSKGSFVLPGLPGGDTLSGELKPFLDDLAEVIRRGNLRVIVEVYSTPAGPPQGNLDTTISRARIIRSYLISNGKVFEDQVEVLGKGSWLLAASADRELRPPAQEESKALIRVLLRR